MIPVLGIPTLCRVDLLRRCIESIDVEIGKLVIVNNGVEKLPDLPANSAVITHPNAGVAASWNEIIKLFPADYWVLCNDDIQFQPGNLTEFERVINESKDQCSGIVANVGASMFAVTVRGVTNVGLFDENFYPAYLEDVDWFRRAKLAKEVLVQSTNVKVVHGVNGNGSQTYRAGRHIQKENDRTYSNNAEYYRAKWGADHRHETFDKPFNDPTWPLDFWHFEPHMRKLNQWSIQQ